MQGIDKIMTKSYFLAGYELAKLAGAPFRSDSCFSSCLNISRWFSISAQRVKACRQRGHLDRLSRLRLSPYADLGLPCQRCKPSRRALSGCFQCFPCLEATAKKKPISVRPTLA